MSANLSAHVNVRVSRVVDELLQSADALRGAGDLLTAQAELRVDADPEGLRAWLGTVLSSGLTAAAGIRAAAMLALSTAAGMAGAAARLDTLAGIREAGDQ